MPEQISSECSVHCTLTKRKGGRRTEGEGHEGEDEGKNGREKVGERRTDGGKYPNLNSETGSDGRRLKGELWRACVCVCVCVCLTA